ncbi:MAG TPA: TetR/AcrR family transcriptional regulator [Anaerolineae bacterium]|nr:TetR/AcrR family transcriptional regulator [Anaerolineae bacterium]
MDDMAYKSSEKTRAKKDAKRTAMMQAAVQVFAQKGYHAATVRDVVKAAKVAIGTFYFYFPDKETLFVYLYEETSDFLLQTIQQAVNQRDTLAQRIQSGIQAYINIGLYDPAVVQLLLVGGVGAVPSLHAKRVEFRKKLTAIWQQVLDQAAGSGEIEAGETRVSAEMLAGGIDEVILNLLDLPTPELKAPDTIITMTANALKLVGYWQTTEKSA